MNRATPRSRKAIAAAGLVGVLALAACGSSKTSAAGNASTAAAGSAAASTTASSTAMTEAPTTAAAMTEAPTTAAAMTGAMGDNFGPGCAAVPADGSGSFAGMAKDPAATAASNNPVLSTLVAAVKAAGLVDTLNGPGPFTIFAPSNDAFGKIDKATIDKLLADPKGDLTKILTLHVVAGKKLSADDLVKAGTEKTVNGGDVKITKAGDTVMVNDAKVICGNLQTANATVFIIDTVLLPAS
jgi:transforming growth factor-beta-induced protein